MRRRGVNGSFVANMTSGFRWGMLYSGSFFDSGTSKVVDIYEIVQHRAKCVNDSLKDG